MRNAETSSEEEARELAETIARLEAMTDDDIDYSDIPPMDFSQPREYYVGLAAWRARKDQVTLRVDRDVLAWFKQNNEKYQTAINQALRDHMDRERKAS